MIALLILTFLAQQPNLELQARQALEKADKDLSEARAAYAKHEMDETRTAIKTMLSDIQLAEKALADTGKNARRRPKEFKYGEMKTRELLKRIDSLENEMDIDDREFVAAAKIKVQEVHDQWLLGIMGAK